MNKENASHFHSSLERLVILMNKKKNVVEFKKYPRTVTSQDINELIEQRRLIREKELKRLRYRWNEMLSVVKNR